MPILLVAVVSGLIGVFWAASKNKNPFLWGLVCLCFPLIGLLILAFSASEESAEAKTGRAVADALQQAGIGGQLQLAAAAESSLAPADEARWRVMVQYDDEIKGAVQRLEPLGAVAVTRFRDIFMILNDKSKISQIIADLERDDLESKIRQERDEYDIERGRELDNIGRNITYLFWYDGNYVCSMKDGSAIGMKDGQYSVYTDLDAFRKTNHDSRAWEEITSVAERRKFIAEAEPLLKAKSQA